MKQEQEERDKTGEEVVNKLCHQLNELQGQVTHSVCHYCAVASEQLRS